MFSASLIMNVNKAASHGVSRLLTDNKIAQAPYTAIEITHIALDLTCNMLKKLRTRAGIHAS